MHLSAGSVGLDRYFVAREDQLLTIVHPFIGHSLSFSARQILGVETCFGEGKLAYQNDRRMYPTS